VYAGAGNDAPEPVAAPAGALLPPDAVSVLLELPQPVMMNADAPIRPAAIRILPVIRRSPRRKAIAAKLQP
jgi:hypothetical protein